MLKKILAFVLLGLIMGCGSTKPKIQTTKNGVVKNRVPKKSKTSKSSFSIVFNAVILVSGSGFTTCMCFITLPQSATLNRLRIFFLKKLLETVKKALEEKGLKITGTSIGLVAKEEVTISEKEQEAAQRLFEALDDNDAVNDIYSNLES